MSARQFVEDVFVTGLGVRYVVLGDDFRFGNDRQGDVRFIQQEGARHGYDAGPTPTQTWQGQRVSSTRIREALEAGGPRIVVFNVAGIIHLKERIHVRAPYITVSGATKA